MEISRHHCLVEINPPLARIRNFGSLNGTFLNDERIGALTTSQKPGEFSPDSPQRDLAHGDKIRLANVVIQVDIKAPVICDECHEEIPQNDKNRLMVDAGHFICDTCRAKKETRQKKEQEQERIRQEALEKERKAKADARRAVEHEKYHPSAAPKPAPIKPVQLAAAPKAGGKDPLDSTVWK